MLIKEKKNVIGYLLAIVGIAGAVAACYLLDPWGFYWKPSPSEQALRLGVVEAAESYLGCKEEDLSHRPIIDLYNSHEPLALDYTVTYTDSWCAAFVSACAIQEGLTDIIPTECGCERQIELFRKLGRWQEDDSIIPLPGDLIYYDWEWKGWGDCTGWSDHVGIVVGTKWPFIKVIEGNKDDSVSYRYILINDKHIRGYGLPHYTALAE